MILILIIDFQGNLGHVTFYFDVTLKYKSRVNNDLGLVLQDLLNVCC